MFMKTPGPDNQNGSTEQWPKVLKIAPEQFQQSFAVAQLAIRLCGLKKDDLQKQWDVEDKIYNQRRNRAVTDAEKEQLNKEREEQMKGRMKTLDAEAFLAEAWDLIESARVNHVLRPQTGLEYMIEQGGGREVAVRVLEHEARESVIRFQKLCNDKETYTEIKLYDAGTDTIIKIEWKVYRSEAGFERLFWRYWNAISVIKNKVKRKKYGEELLASWKKDGMPANDFLALVRFRRESDRRAANLKTKPKPKPH